MKSKQIYEKLSSGQWILTLFKMFNRLGHSFEKDEDLELLARRAAVYFQETMTLYNDTLLAEASEKESERVRVTEDIEANPSKIPEYRNLGWDITKRRKKSLDTESFLRDHGHNVPKEAFALIKTKLPKDLQKELVNYESVVSHSYTIKRSKKESQV